MSLCEKSASFFSLFAYTRAHRKSTNTTRSDPFDHKNINKRIDYHRKEFFKLCLGPTVLGGGRANEINVLRAQHQPLLLGLLVVVGVILLDNADVCQRIVHAFELSNLFCAKEKEVSEGMKIQTKTFGGVRPSVDPPIFEQRLKKVDERMRRFPSKIKNRIVKRTKF